MTINGCRMAVTGGAGFLGVELSRRLLASESVTLDGRPSSVAELLLLDLAAPPADLLADPRVRPLVADLHDSVRSMGDVDVVFHLAGVVSGAAESDFDLGVRTNVDGLRDLLEACRAMSSPPVVVFTSSLAVFGSDPAIGPIGVVDDDTLPRPQSSYGIQKFIGEQFVADYTRKGFIRGRSVRLMTVTVRPGRANAAASSFISGMIREPIAGERSVCPVPPDLPIAVSSPRLTLDGILRAAEVDSGRWGSTTAMNLPSLTTTPHAMAEALERVAGSGRAQLIDWREDPEVIAIVATWPSVFRTSRANAIGLIAEKSFENIVREYVSSASAPASS